MDAATCLRKLTDWLDDPSQLDDVGCDAPTTDILWQAVRLLCCIRDRGVKVRRVVPDPNGGVCFQATDADGLAASYCLSDDGEARHYRFEGHRCVSNEALVVEK